MDAMKIANPENYRWVRAVDPADPAKLIGPAKPCMKNHAPGPGYRVLEGADEAAAIAAARGDEAPAPAQDEPKKPASKPAPGVKSTRNKAADAPAPAPDRTPAASDAPSDDDASSE